LSKKIKIIFLNDYRFYDYNSSIHVGFLSKMQEKYDILEVGENSGAFLICSDTDGLEITPDEYYIKYDHNNMSEFYESIFL